LLVHPTSHLAIKRLPGILDGIEIRLLCDALCYLLLTDLLDAALNPPDVAKEVAHTTPSFAPDQAGHLGDGNSSSSQGLLVHSISILDGSTFIVSDRRGDIEAAPDQPQGLFYRDTRFLSRWVLTVNGAPLDVLSTDETAYSTAQFFLYPPTGTIYENPTLSVIRKRMVGDGFHEDLAVLNHAREPVDVELRLEAGSDFADLFEAHGNDRKKNFVGKKSLYCANNLQFYFGYRAGNCS